MSISHYDIDKEQKQFLKHNTFKGWDFVDNEIRLSVMNLYLHGIGGDDTRDGKNLLYRKN